MRCWSHTVARSFLLLPDPDKSVNDCIPKMESWPLTLSHTHARVKTRLNLDLAHMDGLTFLQETLKSTLQMIDVRCGFFWSHFWSIVYMCTEVRANYNSYQMLTHTVPPQATTPPHSHTHTWFEKWGSQSSAIILHTLVSVGWVGWKVSVKLPIYKPLWAELMWTCRALLLLKSICRSFCCSLYCSYVLSLCLWFSLSMSVFVNHHYFVILSF